MLSSCISVWSHFIGRYTVTKSVGLRSLKALECKKWGIEPSSSIEVNDEKKFILPKNFEAPKITRSLLPAAADVVRSVLPDRGDNPALTPIKHGT